MGCYITLSYCVSYRWVLISVTSPQHHPPTGDFLPARPSPFVPFPTLAQAVPPIAPYALTEACSGVISTQSWLGSPIEQRPTERLSQAYKWRVFSCFYEETLFFRYGRVDRWLCLAHSLTDRFDEAVPLLALLCIGYITVTTSDRRSHDARSD